MQKLVGRDIYTPTDASQVCGKSQWLNWGLSLSREETLSMLGLKLIGFLKTSSNNPEVDCPNIQRALKAYVHVISKDEKPLMPCSRAKVKKLLKKEKAQIVSHKPFTIRLIFTCENQVQPIALGIDSGYENKGRGLFGSKMIKRHVV